MRLGSYGKVLAQPLRAQLADMQHGTDSSYRGNTINCQFGCEPLRRAPKRNGHGHVVLRAGRLGDARAPRMTIIKSSYDTTASTPTEASAVDHLMTRPAMFITRHRRPARTPP